MAGRRPCRAGLSSLQLRSPLYLPAGIPDVVGGRSNSYERKTETGRQEAVSDIKAEAAEVGADAVVGATLDDEEMAEGMLWVNISGTAVRTRRG